ncbi:cytochrome P450 71B34-like [Cucumis melo var. makuwa]|uniref:Cytochrome P450 71B34-like n=3 Tax=Cucumis melo TaxID=3656 RepID=A0A5D3CUU2_CUCMM|nr:cytochrome P450 71B34-like [Cucumis melo]KAA0034254.1 cytochrome P450 71B34-like [Cucumis melo var. makuwa]TYK15667.1 cytochrome P450 71B34-like [Cucumis melo var. makuwa]
MHYYIEMMMNSVFIWLPLLFLLTKKLLKKKNNNLVNNPPPSPPKLPLLGHLHLLGSHPHRSLYNLSQTHGPIMLLKLGSVPTIAISSASAARELFRQHDLASCSRPRLTGSGRFSYNFQDLNLSPYGERWRELRKIFILELFSTKRVQSFHHIREEEIDKLLNCISNSSSLGTPIDLAQTSYALTANVTFRIAFGKRFSGGELDNENFQHIIRRSMVALGSFFATDYFPCVGWIVDWISGVNGTLEKSFGEMDAIFQKVVDDRIKFKESCRSSEENIVDVLLRMERDSSELHAVKFTHECVKALIMDIFLAGVETGENSIIWAMAELIKNPRVMKKLQDEIRSTIKEDRVKESDLEKLQYLKMVVKEVLRLHPPVPLLLPRESMSHFKLNGYDIHPKTHIHVNAWAIGRDPESWKHPLQFIPERFIENNIDYKGQHFELIPFGAGRRICPGMNMGIIIVELALANMLLCFDWKLPNGMKEEDVDMEEDAGLSASKKLPLQLIPIRYSS